MNRLSHLDRQYIRDQFVDDSETRALRREFEELERASSRLSDALMGGAVFQTHGNDRDSVLKAAAYPGKPLIDALESLNAILRNIDKRRKGGL